MWSKTVVFVSLALAHAWVVTADHFSLNDAISNGELAFYDLTHEFDEQKTIYWPDMKPFTFTKKIAENGQYGWYAANVFEAGEHGGTHMDAPYHFDSQGDFLGAIPVDRFIVPLVIIDISSLVNDDPNFVLLKHHLGKNNLLDDSDGKPCMVIFKFGWTKFYGDKQRYMGLNETDGSLNFPGLSKEIAEWITGSHKNVVGIGVDVASVDPGSSESYPVHQTAMRAGLYHMENVKLDRPVPELGCTGIAMPMKIAKGSGGPLRLVAVCPKTAPKPGL